MPVMSLMLPWEVIERVIEHASDDLELLRNFCLTCRQLHPYSFSLIIAKHIFLCSKERMTCFRTFSWKILDINRSYIPSRYPLMMYRHSPL